MSPDDQTSDPVVCFCFGVTRQTVLAVVQRPDVRTVFDITTHCKAGNGCSSCWPLLEELLLLRPPT